jgi:KaiC/GvpD/RAD55 family RecA-like ATPase
MRINPPYLSNEIYESDSQFGKHLEQEIRMQKGIVIDLREEQYENVSALMRVNSESVSNKIDESDLQYEKCSEQGMRT